MFQSLPLYHMSTIKFSKYHIKQIETCIRDFWWGNVIDKKKVYLLSGNRLTVPITQGGLGFEELELISRMIIQKHGRVSIENIINGHSNSTWRWGYIQFALP